MTEGPGMMASTWLGVGSDTYTPLASFLALVSVFSLRVLEVWRSTFLSFMVVPFLFVCCTFQTMTSSWFCFHFTLDDVAQKDTPMSKRGFWENQHVMSWQEMGGVPRNPECLRHFVTAHMALCSPFFSSYVSLF